jgi:hypothetical protein
VIHGDEYITLSEERVDGPGLECPSITAQEVLVSADFDSEWIILDGAL